MSLSIARVQHYLRQFDLEKLFVEELGWDRYSVSLSVQVDGRSYPLRAIAEKRGVQILMSDPGDGGGIPDYATRRRIEKQVTKAAYEHLIIYIDGRKTQQIWQWVFRQPGQPSGYREHHYHPEHHQGDSLIQKLQTITFQLSEEEGLTLTGVAFRLRDAFDRDRVTKKFYEHFKTEHASFLKFIKGIIEQGDREWYASLMLNRLMFVYFIQRKGFLDGDPDYLKNRLKMVRERKGNDKFLTFYRYFLLRLFHEGFSQQPPQRASGLEELLGKVPYLNGGLFELHELEAKYTDLDIPDEAFEGLFAFFDQYEWNLDSRPLQDDREINPDVLGYIFEKYINQKQMGAYYTKEDITEYISKNTIIPYLFDAARKKCAVAFQPESLLWRLLQIDPDRYIYPAVRKGVIDERGDAIPLPEVIARGIEDVSQRNGWNSAASAEFALPTETWREHVARRQRCLEVREKLLTGQIHEINDFITCNLNIRQFAEDVISNCEGAELLRAYYQAINNVTVLDPTCGSGAFLFAAANVLEPLYDACLERMHGFVDDLDRSGERHRPEKLSDFRKVLAEIERHPNRLHFIFKSIILKNLFGVDIMEEAVEICKLRLFLKLVAQVEKVKYLEPLPDIDFNIRAGNTLVGFTSVAEIRRAAELETPKVRGSASKQILMVSGQAEKTIRRIEEEARVVERAFHQFHNMQSAHEMDARELATAKVELRDRLKKLTQELNWYLAREYHIDSSNAQTYEKWRASHQPFHWFAEFYGIMHSGGFDVVIGNPPYLEYSKVADYSIRNYETQRCANLYVFTVERSLALSSSKGHEGMIIPISVACSGAMEPLRNLFMRSTRSLWLSHFSNRPGQLFAGAQNRLTIFLTSGQHAERKVFSTRYHRWDAKNGERESLFSALRYQELGSPSSMFHHLLPKLGCPEAAYTLAKIKSAKTIEFFTSGQGRHKVFWVRVPGYFCQFLLTPPKARPESGGQPRVRGEVNHIGFADQTARHVVHSILNSSTYYQFFCTYTDTRHINPSDVSVYPLDLTAFSNHDKTNLAQLSLQLSKCFDTNTTQSRKSGLLIDSIDSKPCKAILDEIDRVLAKHYGFTDEELDFIINYDIKYRMGTGNDPQN